MPGRNKTKKKGKYNKISRKKKPIQSRLNQIRNEYNDFLAHEEEDWRNDILKKEEQIYYDQIHVNRIIRKLEIEEKWKNEDEKKALNKYLDELQEEKRNIEFKKQMFDLKYSPAEDLYYNLYTAYHKTGTRNPRIFIITGHSYIPAKELKRQNTKDIDWLPRVFKNPYKMRQITTQSLGKLSMTSFYKKFVLALRQNVDFYRTLVETETDGDCKNLNKIYLQYLLGTQISQINSDTFDYIRQKLASNYITDFRIYPKPKNPKLPQNPPQKIYNFLSNVYDGKIERQFRGVFEITQINSYGWYEVDHFMVISQLDELFKSQYDIIPTMPDPYDALLLLLMTNLRIPSAETEKLILKKMGKAYLDKLNRLNKINRSLFEHIKFSIDYKKSKKTIEKLDSYLDVLTLNVKSRDYFNIYPLDIYTHLMDYIDDTKGENELSADEEDILLIDGGCNNIDDSKYITTYWDQTIEHPELSKYVAVRSNSAISNILSSDSPSYKND